MSEPYLVINLIFAIIILLVLLYCGIFSPDRNNYPVACIHEKITGQPCASCGLSHSLSLILRGRTGEAYNWNMNGMPVFIFLAAQLIMRISFSLVYIRNPHVRKQVIIMDSAGSALIFLITFMPFIVSIFKWL